MLYTNNFMINDFYVKVRVKTNQKNESLQKVKDNAFVISIKEKPERNIANQKIIQILEQYYGPESVVKIINGQHHPIKLIKIDLKK